MIMSMKRFILIALCIFSFSASYANEVVRVRKAVGRWEVSDDITPKQAEEKALNEAKKEALRMAGVMENVWSVFGQVTADNGTEFTNRFTSHRNKPTLFQSRLEQWWKSYVAPYIA